jgi:hypothetical protein
MGLIVYLVYIVLSDGHGRYLAADRSRKTETQKTENTS